MASVVLDRVSVELGGAFVLRDVSVEIPHGLVLGIIGPSGSGKSTLLRAVAGLAPVSSGAVQFDDIDMAGWEPADRNIGMVFQDNVLYPQRTVRRNVAFPLEVRKLSEDEVARRVEAEARVLEIERLLDRYPKTLSAGHQQLVQAARAFVRAPTVFLMDEPLARLDAKLRAVMRHELALLQRGYGVTMLYATNDQAEALALADLLLVLREGRVSQVGEPMEVYRRPKDRFVAEFVGSPAMRFVAGKVHRDGSGYMIDMLGTRTRAWDPNLGAVTGRPVIIGLRPEEVALDRGGSALGIVTGNEYTGDYGWSSVTIGAETVLARSHERSPEVGTPVGVVVSAFHVFDEGGNAVAHVRLPGVSNSQ